jgi:hypothetical protein
MSALAQQLLTAVQTDNVDEISRLVAAGISLRNLPGNSVTQRRLLNAVSPRLLAGPRNAKAAKAAAIGAAKEALTAARLASRTVPKSQSAGPLLAAHRAMAAAPAAVQVTVEGELKLIGGRLYMVRNGNVYEYHELEESAGDFVGRLTAHETIDTSAAEVASGGSRSRKTRRHRSTKNKRSRKTTNRSRRN